MKVCPICNSNVFSDMDTCFNCLHKFEDKHEIKSRTPSEFVRVGGSVDMSDFLHEYHKFLGSYINSRSASEVV